MEITSEFTAIGGNRNPAAADWDITGTHFLAFGADNCVALWDPQDRELRSVRCILNGHSKTVTSVKFYPTRIPDVSLLLTGSADSTIRVWRVTTQPSVEFDCLKTISEHKNSVTRIAILEESQLVATGASDGTVKIWKLVHDPAHITVDVKLQETIELAPRYFPLNLALAALDNSSMVLAVAGTQSTIQIFVSTNGKFSLQSTLTGHEGWIRALSFTRETESANSDLLLASASQDRYIRLWRLHQGDELPIASNALNDPALGALSKSLSNKAYWFSTGNSKYSITFEALLLGHEDWIYQAAWRHRAGTLQLLTASEDNSLAIWESDSHSGIWICVTRLGEISAQKGSTSATGSAGGFWIGLWSPDSSTVVALGRTGSWRKWTFSNTEDMWTQQVAITGHVREVRGVCWSRDGQYLLTTGSDQTTRLFSQWKRETFSKSWHEFSRPQIHGYDLNCIDTVNDGQFLSGADEKLLRVFDEPKGVAEILDKLCDIHVPSAAQLPDAANIPVLGLSNKAIQVVGGDEPIDNGDEDDGQTLDPSSVVRQSILDVSHPPFEDHLARHLLWPETEKLYGHGYEISAVAVSRDGKLVATACRASSIDHAVIRLYDTKEWLEVKPALRAHSLTVTSLQFSMDDQYLLSTGRDRQWALWERNHETSLYSLKHSNPKGHTRMILGAAWIPFQRPTFITAGRDKSMKIWQVEESFVQLKGTATATAAITAVACHSRLTNGSAYFAYGTETGDIAIGCTSEHLPEKVEVFSVARQLSPTKTINQIAWRPEQEGDDKQMAIVSDDTSLRVYNIRTLSVC